MLPLLPSKFRRAFASVCLGTFVLFSASFFVVPLPETPALAAAIPQVTRLAGADRYSTAVQISQAGWTSAANVVLARGDDFPDALAGSVLARKVNGPLLLTQPNQLPPAVLNEILRLQAGTVYILGGTGAVSQAVQDRLSANNLKIIRLAGHDRFDTAAQISLNVAPSSSQAFLAYGLDFPDALSVSSYAAAHGIPLLLTGTSSVPAASLNALKSLHVTSVTLIGGPGVIGQPVQTELQAQLPGVAINRLAGPNRYQTNTTVLNSLNFNAARFYVATGEDFPDALAGGSLAAQQNNPIVLVPSKDLDPATLAYLAARRTAGSTYTVLGGWGVISYGIESIVRTGSTGPRLSLQYIHGLSYPDMVNRLSIIPGNPTDSVDIISPDWYQLADGNGSVSGAWDGTSDGTANYSQFVQAAHSRNLKVLPLINSSWASSAPIDSMLQNPAARANLISQLLQRIQSIGADGVLIDFEFMSQQDGPYLTQFMQSLYSSMRSNNKMVVMAVMSRTAGQTWSTQFNYHDLAQSVDYLNIMTYDHSTSSPGPIAPLAWVKDILSYTESQGVDMSKVLLGIPYYGRDWSALPGGGYAPKGIDLSTALNTATLFGITPQRLTAPDDPVGIPYFNYIDIAGVSHTVYYDDPQSWAQKLALLDQYHLGGIGAWSLYWVKDAATANQLFPLLKQHLR